MVDDAVPAIRKLDAFPAEHMRMIGEIVVYWTALEALILQAVCESAKLGQYEGIFLGTNIPSGTRIDMLSAVAHALRENKPTEETGKKFARLIEAVRSAYLLRNKYAHARLKRADRIKIRKSSRREQPCEFKYSYLSLTKIKADADQIFEAGELDPISGGHRPMVRCLNLLAGLSLLRP